MQNRPAIASVALVAAMIASGCTSSIPSTHTPASSIATGSAAAAGVPPAVTALAHLFADQFVSSQYGSQWAELSPQTQAMWPSEAARTHMLSTKFAGHVAAMMLGAPSLQSIWTEPEHPVVRIANVWSVPVHLDLALPQSLRPEGVASLFSMTSVDIELQPSGVAEIVGEGPASMDAPIILPPTIPAVRISVPILMYHLVDGLPPRSIEPSTYGWKLEIGLTTSPAEFATQMAYLKSIDATSISLEHLADGLLYGLPLPPHAVVITFDDGRLSPWYHAVPLLRQDGFTAVFFPCVGLIGKKVGPQTYLSAAEIHELAGGGFSVQDHTFNDAQVLFGASAAVLNALTNRTKSALEQLTGAPVQFLAYTGVWPWPNATQGGSIEATTFSRLAAFGYIGGVLDVRVDSVVESSTQLWQLPRVRIDLQTTLASFARWFGGRLL